MKAMWKHPRLKKGYEGQYSTIVLNNGKKKRIFLIVNAQGKTKYEGSPSQAKKAGWFQVK